MKEEKSDNVEMQIGFEQLNQLWKEQSEKLDVAIDLQHSLYEESRISQVSSALRRFTIFPVLDLMFGMVIMIFAWSFVLENWPVGYLLAPAVSLLVFAHAAVAISIYDLTLIGRVSFGGSICETQSLIERLKSNRIREFKWAVLLAPWLGFSFFMMVIAWVTDFQVFQKLSMAWILGNFIFGILFIPVGLWIAQRLAQRKSNAAWLQNVCDGVSGTNLAVATRHLQELQDLSRPAGAAEI